MAVVSPVTAGMPDVFSPDGASEVLVCNDAPVNTVGCETIAAVSMDVDVVGDVNPLKAAGFYTLSSQTGRGSPTIDDVL